MNSSQKNKYDFIEDLIFNEGIRIVRVEMIPESDLFLIITNKNTVLPQRLSAFTRLKGKEATSLQKYKLIGGGTGIHWPELDEDLCLKGFLQQFFKSIVFRYPIAV